MLKLPKLSAVRRASNALVDENLILARGGYTTLLLVGTVEKKMYLAEKKLLIASMGFCGMPALLASLLFLIKELGAPSEVRLPFDKQA